MAEDYLKIIFGDQLPRETFWEKIHPVVKLITMFFFSIMAMIYYRYNFIIMVLIFYLFLISLNRQNPFKPWFMWLFIILGSYLYYTISPTYFPDKSFDIKEYSRLIILMFLVIAPFTQISKTINPYELSQTLHYKLNWLSVIIMTFVRYLTVSKQQFIKTNLAFNYRNVNIRKNYILFLTTWITNNLKHSQKYADNIIIRNLDNPKLLYDKPTYSVYDFALLGSYFILILIDVFPNIFLFN